MNLCSLIGHRAGADRDYYRGFESFTCARCCAQVVRRPSGYSSGESTEMAAIWTFSGLLAFFAITGLVVHWPDKALATACHEAHQEKGHAE